MNKIKTLFVVLIIVLIILLIGCTKSEKIILEELVPSAVYLIDDTRECNYNYNGNIINVPVIKCNNFEEERIEYKDENITFYLNECNVVVNEQTINIFENNISGYVDYIQNRMITGESKIQKISDKNNIKGYEIPYFYIDSSGIKEEYKKIEV